MDFKEMLIAKKYCDRQETIQGYFTVPAGTTVTVTYNPPQNYVWVPFYATAGSVRWGIGLVTIYTDRTRTMNQIIPTGVLEHILGWSPINYVKSELEVVITNTDVVASIADFMFVGFLIPDSLLVEFIEEATGRKDRKVLEEIRDLLKSSTKR